MKAKENLWDSTSDEIYALLVADFLHPEIAAQMLKWESPDWKSEKADIGLEVTRAETKHIGYTDRVMTRYFGCKKEEIPEKIVRNFRGELFFHEERLFAVSDSKGLVDGNRHVTLLLEHLEQKLQKLNGKNFLRCERNLLFEYATNAFRGDNAVQFARKIKEINLKYRKIFDEIIVGAFEEAVCFFSDGTISIKPIPMAELTHITQQYRSVCSWERGTHFSDVQKLVSDTEMRKNC